MNLAKDFQGHALIVFFLFFEKLFEQHVSLLVMVVVLFSFVVRVVALFLDYLNVDLDPRDVVGEEVADEEAGRDEKGQPHPAFVAELEKGEQAGLEVLVYAEEAGKARNGSEAGRALVGEGGMLLFG